MIEYISHRVNKKEDLLKTPLKYGVELDLRDGLDGRIYIEHNPFTGGEDFEEYLKEYHHGTMILNIKSERIEEKVLELVHQYDVKSYFFLDSSFPMIFLLASKGISDTAIRFSEFEGLDTICNMAGKVKWVWVDCFTRMPLTAEIFAQLKKWGYKICIVSPELQGQPDKIEVYAEMLKNQNIFPDAICTKQYQMNRWMNYFPEK